MSLALSSVNAPFASGEVVHAEACRAFLPKQPQLLSAFASMNRYVSNEGGGYVGRWSHEVAPYLMEPMDALSDITKLTVAVVGPGQCGKTEIARNWLLASVIDDPADMLWYSASEPLVTGEVKTGIKRLIDNHPKMKATLSDNSLQFKRFGSMGVYFMAGIMGNFINKYAPRIVADEFDAMCRGLSSLKSIMDLRRQTFGNKSKLLALSHPDMAEGVDPKDWNGGVMELYRESDQRRWYWGCPGCGVYSSPNPGAERQMILHFDEKSSEEEIRASARLLCPANGCLIEDEQRHDMNLTGKWVGLGQQIDEDGVVTGSLKSRDTAGFWIVGVMSPFLLSGIGGLAVEQAKADNRFANDNDTKARSEVYSKQLGYAAPRDVSAQAIDATTIAERAEADLELGVVANGVRFITVMIDIQGNRFEMLARGWCEGGRSVVVDFKNIPGSPSTSASDWDEVLRLATTTVWPLQGRPGQGMRAIAVGYDTAGADGVTVQAYDAWRRLKLKKGVRFLGKIDGRPIYTVLPMKGASTLQAPRLQIVFPNLSRGDRLAQARGEIPVGSFNPNSFKDDLNGQLMLADDVAWSIRFPKALAAKQAPHPWFEQLVAEQRLKSGRWNRRQNGRPNEALDLMVGTHVLAFMMGVQRIRWDAPPVWARVWDENVNVVAVPSGPPSGDQAGVGLGSQRPPPPAREGAPAATVVKRSWSEQEFLALNRQKLAVQPAKRIVDSVPVRR